MTSKTGTFAVLVPLVLCAAAGLQAQSAIWVTPYTGVFAPLRDFATLETAAERDVVRQRQTVALLVGARLHIRTSAVTGIEFGVGRAASGLRQKDTNAGVVGLFSAGLDGAVTAVDGRFVVRPRRSAVYGLAGVSMLHRSGVAWDEHNGYYTSGVSFNKTSLAALAGLGLFVQGTNSVRVDVSLEARIHRRSFLGAGYDAGVGTIAKGAGTKADLALVIGFPIG